MTAIVKYKAKDPKIRTKENRICGNYPYHILAQITVEFPGEYVTQCCESPRQPYLAVKRISKCVLCGYFTFAEDFFRLNCSGWSKITPNEI